MNSFDINTFIVNKNYTIEASAGTGKTYSIKLMVKKIVDTTFNSLYGNQSLTVQEIREKKTEILNKILIVTYTEKAAGELKSRIRGELSDVDVDNAPIYTIHSFCKTTISEFGISANQALDLSLSDDNALLDFIDRYLREGAFLGAYIVAKKLGKTKGIDEYKKDFANIINKYYLDKDGNEVPSIIALEDISKSNQLFNYLNIINYKTFTDVLNNYPDIKANYEVFSNSGLPEAEGFANDLASSYLSGFNYDGKKYKASIKWIKDNQSFLDAFNFFYELKNFFKDKVIEKVMPCFIKDLYLKWIEEKEKNKAQAFDDMIRNVREALLEPNSKLLTKLKDKYNYAIIDEFQDTNQKQFDIFKKIFMEDDDHHIIVVGDPKQSIYSFQGADVNVYKKATQAIIDKGGEQCYLDTNYRSSPKMVDACNHLFKYYEFFKGETFQDSKWKTKDIKRFRYKGEEVPSIWIGVNPDNKAINEKEYSHIVASQIIDFCSKDDKGNTNLQIDKGNGKFINVTFKDFAILCKARSELTFFKNALTNVGIPYLLYKDSSLFKGNECKQWVSLLEAIDAPDFTGSNRGKYKKSLLTPFFGLSIKEISQDKYNNDDEIEAKKNFRWKLLAKLRRWEDLFDSIIMDSSLLNVLQSLGHMQTLAKIKQLADYCVEYLSENKTLKDLIRTLKNYADGGSSDDDDDDSGAIVARATNFDSVQIMTIHASKGLQFPVVICVGGFKDDKPGGVQTYHVGDNQYLTFDSSKAKDERTAEWKRLYYVAYTRAEYLMVLPYYLKFAKEFLNDTLTKFMNNDQSHYRLIKYATPDFDALKIATQDILKGLDSSSNDVSSKEEQSKRLKVLIDNKEKQSTYKHSYSSLSHGNDDHDDEEIIIDGEIILDKEGYKGEGLKEFDLKAKPIDADYHKEINPITLCNKYPSGSSLGSALHEIFERLDYTDQHLNEEEIIEARFNANGFKINPEIMNSTKEIIDNVLEAKLPIIHGNHKEDNYFKLKEISNDDKKAEMEFNFNLVPEKLRKYCNGFIDLVFRKDGYYSVLDWKSDRLNEDDFKSYSSLKDLKEHVDNTYSIQRVLYSYCLIKWIKGFKPNLSEQEIFDTYFGGVYYVFLRGCNKNISNGVYSQTWESYNDLLDAFNKIVKEKAGVNE